MPKKFLYIDLASNDGATLQGPNDVYETTDFLNVSAGVTDAGKPIKLDATGKIPASMIDSGDVDHDATTNFVANEHIDWTAASAGSFDPSNFATAVLTGGTRPFTAIQSYSGVMSFNSDYQVVYKKYVDDTIASALQGTEWLDSVLDLLATPPGSPATGARYLIIATATGVWAGKEDQVAEWSGTAWVYTVPTTGSFVSVDTDATGVYYYGGTGWSLKGFESTTASRGLVKVGTDIRLNPLASGGLVALDPTDPTNPNKAYVDVDVLVGEGLTTTGTAPLKNMVIDWSTAFNDSKAVKASDLAAITVGKGASIIGVQDAGLYYANANVETVLQEIGSKLTLLGTTYTVGTGGVTKGDLVYVSANDTVNKYSNISVFQVVIGMAAETKTAGQTVTVLGNDTILTGVLTTATAGKKYFWNGSGYTNNLSTFTSGQHIWLGGVAKNATDAHVEVEFLVQRA